MHLAGIEKHIKKYTEQEVIWVDTCRGVFVTTRRWFGKVEDIGECKDDDERARTGDSIPIKG